MDDVAGIYARASSHLDRYVQLGIAQGRVISVSFPTVPPDESTPDHELLDRIEEYLRGTEDDFSDVTIALTLPTEQRKTLEQVQQIPYGEQVTVEQLGRMTPGFDADSTDDLVSVREALSENPAPLFVPDHRVRDGPSGAPGVVEQRLRSVEGL
jgi:methylated-DNA-[protein]-cysteine S-methyltransferase